MADKKLYLCVTPAPDSQFDEWCYPVNTDDKSWKSILSDIETTLECAFINNDDKLEGVKISCEIKLMDPDDIMDVSDI